MIQKGWFYKEPVHIFYELQKYFMKILLGNFKEKLGIEEIFKLKKRK
jgi:hypothetical protein